MRPEQMMERATEIAEELRTLNRVPPEAGSLLDRELERLAVFHTERCCDPRLSPEQSAMHREARALARGLIGFYPRRIRALKEEMATLRGEAMAKGATAR